MCDFPGFRPFSPEFGILRGFILSTRKKKTKSKFRVNRWAQERKLKITAISRRLVVKLIYIYIYNLSFFPMSNKCYFWCCWSTQGAFFLYLFFPDSFLFLFCLIIHFLYILFIYLFFCLSFPFLPSKFCIPFIVYSELPLLPDLSLSSSSDYGTRITLKMNMKSY